jgi:diguanylate cyclase (GGDEF)-like protein/PAS domain S-box-containing protein
MISARDEHALVAAAVEAIAQSCALSCTAVFLADDDATLRAAAAGEDHAYAAAINHARVSLADDAIVAQAILSGEPAALRDPRPSDNSALLQLYPKKDAVRAVLALPIAAGAGALGVFLLFSEAETAFSGGQINVLAAFARVAGRQIVAGRDVAQARAAVQAWQAREDMELALQSAADEPAVLRHAAESARALSGAAFAVAWSLQANVFAPAAVAGDDAGFAAAVKFNADGNTALGQGPTGRAARSGQIETVKDALSDRSFSPWVQAARRCGVRGVLALPLATGTHACVVALYAGQPDFFDAQIVARLEPYLAHARQALQRVRAAEGAQRTARAQAAAQTAAGGGVAHSLDPAQVMHSIARVTGQTVAAQFTVVYASEGELLVAAAGWNAPGDLSVGVALNTADKTLSAYPAVQAFAERRPVKVLDAPTDLTWLRQGWDQQALTHGFTSVYALPLLDGGRPAGCVALFFHKRTLLEDGQLAALQRLSAEGAAALEAAHTYERARSARDFLGRVLQESTDAIVQLDPRGVVVGWNSGAQRIYGLSAEEALGKLFYDMPLIDGQTRDEMREAFSRVARGEHVHSLEFIARSRTGEKVELLFSASPSRDENGNIVGLTSFSKDISQQKKQYDQLLKQNSALLAVRDAARTFLREVGLPAISQKGLDKILELMRLDAGRVYVLNSGGSSLVNVAQRGFSAEGCQPIEVRAMMTGDEGIVCGSAFYRQSMLLNDGESVRIEHPHFTEQAQRDVSVVLTKPLTIGDSLIGVIQVIGFGGRHISFEEQNIFHAVTEELAVAMQNAQLYDQAARMAITDPLTGLYNFRFMQDFLKKRLSEARRRKRPFSLIMLDVDGLHSINERFGHALGDEVLREFGRAISASVRLSDVVARYGGDEFVVLLPETQLSDALMLAERMTHALTQRDWPEPLAEVTISAAMGCAAFPEAGAQVQMLLKAADSALFEAKRSGKSAIYPRYDSLPKFAG